MDGESKTTEHSLYISMYFPDQRDTKPPQGELRKTAENTMQYFEKQNMMRCQLLPILLHWLLFCPLQYVEVNILTLGLQMTLISAKKNSRLLFNEFA